MPAEKLIVGGAIVLKLTPTGERFTQARLLCSELGTLSVLKRNHRKQQGLAIDLFDQGEAHIDRKAGEEANHGFLTDFVVSKKRSGIGRSYRSLQAASWLSGLLLQNPMHGGTGEDLFTLAERAFDALSETTAPHAVLLKTLYLFARDEGYPVLQDWGKNLTANLSSDVAYLLKTPLQEIDRDPARQEAAFSSLAHYVAHHTHINLPAPTKP